MLLDFNLSFDTRLPAQRLGGTLPYMAPERLRALDQDPELDPLQTGVRTDLFALGVLLYELLAGSHPFGPIPLKFSAEELRTYLLERQQIGPRPLAQTGAPVERPLARLIERCLAFDPCDRLPTGEALAAALRHELSLRRRARRWVARHPRVALGVMLVALFLGLATTGWLVTRDPYSVRQWHQGLAHYGQGEYDKAVAHFNQALESDPSLGQVRFQRGRAFQHLDDLTLALTDYHSASEKMRDGRIPACVGYCLSRQKQHEPAVGQFRRAIAEGYAPGEVYNDLGYCYLSTGEYAQARDALDRAVELEPGLQAAFHNRALVQFQAALSGQSGIARSGLADVQRAIALGPGTADLYRTSASLAALTGATEDALRYLQQAVELGQDPRFLRSNPTFALLRNHPQFQALLGKPSPTTPPRQAVRLVDPVRDRP
jgi:tetratricopeptide (TPR) repeat protein